MENRTGCRRPCKFQESQATDPAHPYTRSLVDAIPWPDPARRWPELDPDMRAGWSAASIIRNPVSGFQLEPV